MRSKVFGARYGDTERLGFALPTPGDGVVGNGREAFIGQGLVGDLEILRCTGLLECALENMRVGVFASGLEWRSLAGMLGRGRIWEVTTLLVERIRGYCFNLGFKCCGGGAGFFSSCNKLELGVAA